MGVMHAPRFELIFGVSPGGKKGVLVGFLSLVKICFLFIFDTVWVLFFAFSLVLLSLLDPDITDSLGIGSLTGSCDPPAHGSCVRFPPGCE